ncbi:hypothetical protein LLG95_05240 [bacterium]|nr:hypothetical protein [bacterium]
MKKEIVPRVILLIAILTACGMVLMASGCAGMAGFVTGHKNEIKVGLSEVNITPVPDQGWPMVGYRRYGKSNGTHDPLMARCIAIEASDGTKAELLIASVVGCSRDTFTQVRKQIAARTGIPFKNIMFSVTHTHSGPAVSGDYLPQFIKGCVEAGVKAYETRSPGRIAIGPVDLPTIASNDRRMAYGGRTTDPTGSIIKVEDPWGRLRGVAFCYGLHPTTLDMHNLLFTEDYYGYAISGIKKKLGGDVWVAYYQSAEGDSKGGHTPEVSALGTNMTNRMYDWAEIRGNLFVDPVCAAVAQIKTESNPVVKVADDTFEYPRRTAYPISVAEAQRIYDDSIKRLRQLEEAVAKQPPYPTDKEELERELPMPPNWQYYQDPSTIKNTRLGMRIVDEARIDVFLAGLSLGTAKRVADPKNPKSMKIEQMAIRIGDGVVLSMPGEIFTDLSRDVKKGSAFGPLHTMTVGLALDSGGYMPPEREFLEGRYAVLGSMWSPKTGEVFVKDSIELIKRVH